MDCRLFQNRGDSIHKQVCITAPFNNMRILKFKGQPTNAFFAAPVNLMFSGSSQLPTAAECAVIKSLSTVQTTKQFSAVVSSENAFVGCALNFRVRMLLRRSKVKKIVYGA